MNTIEKTTAKTVTTTETIAKKEATKMEKTTKKATATKAVKTAPKTDAKKAEKPATPKRSDRVAENLANVIKYVGDTPYSAHKSHANRLQVKAPRGKSFHIIVNADGARIFLHAEAFKTVKAFAVNVSEGLAGQYETAATFNAKDLEKVLGTLCAASVAANAEAAKAKAEKAAKAKAEKPAEEPKPAKKAATKKAAK